MSKMTTFPLTNWFLHSKSKQVERDEPLLVRRISLFLVWERFCVCDACRTHWFTCRWAADRVETLEKVIKMLIAFKVQPNREREHDGAAPLTGKYISTPLLGIKSAREKEKKKPIHFTIYCGAHSFFSQRGASAACCRRKIAAGGRSWEIDLTFSVRKIPSFRFQLRDKWRGKVIFCCVRWNKFWLQWSVSFHSRNFLSPCRLLITKLCANARQSWLKVGFNNFDQIQKVPLRRS